MVLAMSTAQIRLRLQALYQWLKGFLILMVRQYLDKSCQQSAASLTYMTLFATVPLLTVAYSMFSIIPAFQHLGGEFQTLILSNVLPDQEEDVSQDIGQYLTSFSEQARQLTWVGGVFLLVSAYLMLKNIEKTFNAIWGVARGRRGIANFLLYWAILSLGPLLLGAALAMSTYLTSLQLLVGTYDSLGLLQFVFRYLPWLLTWAAFTLLFVAVPNCKVPVRHALVGGLVTTIAFQVLKATFAWAMSNSTYNLVYGAFAALPLFMLWVNIIWMVILGGAVFVHSIKFYQIRLQNRHYPDLFASALVIWHLSQASQRSQHMNEWQIMQLGLSTQQWRRISDKLLEQHVIAQTQQGDFVLCYDLHRLSLAQLAQLLGQKSYWPSEDDQAQALPWRLPAEQYLGEQDKLREAHWQVSLADLFNAEPEQSGTHSGPQSIAQPSAT